jgi:hypothetical protein
VRLIGENKGSSQDPRTKNQEPNSKNQISKDKKQISTKFKINKIPNPLAPFEKLKFANLGFI